MNRKRELVVDLSKLTKDFQAMAQKRHELLELLNGGSDNLVVQLIGNDLKAQSVEQMNMSNHKSKNLCWMSC